MRQIILREFRSEIRCIVERRQCRNRQDKMADTILEVVNLTKIFFRSGQEKLAAVNGVSFSLSEGETLGIIGESGSGKSTVANMITRLLDATEGTIRFLGEDITKKKGKDLISVYRSMQMVFQTPVDSFDPRRRLGDGIGECLRNSGMSRREVKEEVVRLLIQCGLSEEFYDRYPHEVSGGQCQRAAIARALAIKPRLLICDEATSALDVTIQKEILELLSKLRKDFSLSILFICHDIALISAFCDRVLVMHRGKIVEEGVPDEVVASPQNEYTKRLIECVL